MASIDGSVILAYVALDPVIRGDLRPPLGLLYLGAVLREHDIPTMLFDLQHEGTPWSRVEQAIAEAEPCLVGLTCDSDNIHRVLHLSDRLLSRHPNATVVLGGHHVTHVWEPYVTERRIIVRGEGEYPLLLLAQHFLEGKGRLSDVPGIVYSSCGKVHVNPISHGPYEDVDAIPFPDFSLSPARDSYLPAVITARGCTYDCLFCSEGSSNRGFRPRSVANVERELTAIRESYEGRVPYLSFVDDTFTSSAARVREMCDMLRRVFPDPSDLAFYCEGRVNVLAQHPDLIHRLREAGLVRLQIGIESGDQAMLDRIGKRTRVEQIEKVVATCGEAGVPSVMGAFICGLPGQTAQLVEEDIAFAKRLVDLAPGRAELYMVPLLPLPGTQFRLDAAQWGLSILDGDFLTDRLTHNAPAETMDLSKEQIEALCERFKAEVRHYTLDKASALTPHEIKELIALAADFHAYTMVVTALSRFDHVDRVLQLRRRADHRFLSELPHDVAPEDCFPQRVLDNSVKPTNGIFMVNGESPLGFTLTPDEMEYYRYLTGKLPFKEIARRLAQELGVPGASALAECIGVYRKCEDCLAAITVF